MASVMASDMTKHPVAGAYQLPTLRYLSYDYCLKGTVSLTSTLANINRARRNQRDTPEQKQTFPAYPPFVRPMYIIFQGRGKRCYSDDSRDEPSSLLLPYRTTSPFPTTSSERCVNQGIVTPAS